jgi:hypothetical protein
MAMRGSFYVMLGQTLNHCVVWRKCYATSYLRKLFNSLSIRLRVCVKTFEPRGSNVLQYC